jgi:hypothetical protein
MANVMTLTPAADTALIVELLALLGCQSLSPFFSDFNLPPDMSHNSKPLRDRANLFLREILNLQGDFFSCLQQTNELFQDFLAGLGLNYSSETVDQFIDWVKRHGVDHDYFACLDLWALTLAGFDGWVIHDDDPKTESQPLARGFAIYKRLLSSNDMLRRSWVEERLLSIQDRLENDQSFGLRDHFLADYTHSQQILFVEIRILTVERAYRFLSDLKENCDEDERFQVIDCAREMGANSGWPPEHLENLTLCFAEGRKGSGPEWH